MKGLKMSMIQEIIDIIMRRILWKTFWQGNIRLLEIIMLLK